MTAAYSKATKATQQNPIFRLCVLKHEAVIERERELRSLQTLMSIVSVTTTTIDGGTPSPNNDVFHLLGSLEVLQRIHQSPE